MMVTGLKKSGSLGTQFSDMRFVQNFTPPDFRAKTFTPSISPNFKGFIDKKQTMNLNGQISTLPSGYLFKFQLVPKYISKVKLSIEKSPNIVSEIIESQENGSEGRKISTGTFTKG